MGLFNLFRRKTEANWEQLFSGLAKRISDSESRLSSIPHRRRRTASNWLYYSVSVYCLIFLSYFTYLRPRKDAWDIWFLKTAPVVSGPFCIYFVRRLIFYLYSKSEASERVTLEDLKARQREKVDDFKKVTDYESTKKLMDRYDPGAIDALARSPLIPIPASVMGSPFAPKIMDQAVDDARMRVASQNLQGGNATLRGKAPPDVAHTDFAPNPADNAAPFREPQRIPQNGVERMKPDESSNTPKGWMEAILDLMVGEIETPATNYALICGECSTHNGLVPPSQFNITKFKCMSCGALNLSAQRKSQLAAKQTNTQESDGRPRSEASRTPKKIKPRASREGVAQRTPPKQEAEPHEFS